jgi:hypothetical protein
MAPAEMLGLSSSIVVVVDQTDGKLGAFIYDDVNNRFEHMPVIEFQGAGNAPRPGGGR